MDSTSIFVLDQLIENGVRFLQESFAPSASSTWKWIEKRTISFFMTTGTALLMNVGNGSPFVSFSFLSAQHLSLDTVYRSPFYYVYICVSVSVSLDTICGCTSIPARGRPPIIVWSVQWIQNSGYFRVEWVEKNQNEWDYTMNTWP